MRATVEAYLRGETPTYHCEFRVRRKDGGWSWFESRGQIVQWTVSGAPGRMVGTHLDITERKTNEQLRRSLERAMQGNRAEIESVVEAQAAKLLEAANAATAARQCKATFLRSMNHELRSPLNVVIGFSSLLLDKELTGELPPEIREPIEHVNKAGNRLFKVVQQLLDVSSVEAGLLEIRPVPMNLRTLLMQECEDMQAKAKERGLDLRPVACDGHLQVLADKARLGQVVNALLEQCHLASPTTATSRCWWNRTMTLCASKCMTRASASRANACPRYSMPSTRSRTGPRFTGKAPAWVSRSAGA